MDPLEYIKMLAGGYNMGVPPATTAQQGHATRQDMMRRYPLPESPFTPVDPNRFEQDRQVDLATQRSMGPHGEGMSHPDNNPLINLLLQISKQQAPVNF